jgi:hypothetical protein
LAINAELSAAQNDGPQAAAPAQKLLGPRRDGMVHPIARLAFFHPSKAHALNLELHSDQPIQIHARRDHIAAEHSRAFVWQRELSANRFPDFNGEEGDLTGIVWFAIEEAVARNAATRHAFNRVALDDGMIACGFPMTAKKIVAG